MDIINGLREKSKKLQYNFQPDARIYRRMVDKWDAEFSIPEFLFERERYVYILRNMYIWICVIYTFIYIHLMYHMPMCSYACCVKGGLHPPRVDYPRAPDSAAHRRRIRHSKHQQALRGVQTRTAGD